MAARRVRWVLAVVGVVVVVALALPSLMREPLRRHLEARLNAQLEGYTVKLGGAAYRLPVTVELQDAFVTQNARPDPPVAYVQSLRISVQWRALLAGAVVADVVMDWPILHIDRRQAEAEARDPVPLQERGWQRALEAIYPLKINRFDLRGGDVTYVDQGQPIPVRVVSLDAQADDIRNVHSQAGTYPSQVHARGRLDESPVTFDGRADFLAEPYAAVLGDFSLRDLPLPRVEPLLALYHLKVRRGSASLNGTVEYGPSTKRLHVREAALENVTADYVQGQPENPPPVPGGKESPMALRVDSVRLTNGDIGTIDPTSKPPFRLFVTKATIDGHDFSSVAADKKTSRARLRGRFMDSGSAAVDTTVRATQPAADFDLTARLENTDLTKLNDLLQARGKFDVARGELSVYSELHVRSDRVQGYVKPLFVDVDVYSPRQDAGDAPLQQAYEGLVGGLATVVRNLPRDQVATKTDLSGPIENPHADVLEIAAQLVRNAFVKAILPGLEGRRAPEGGDGKQ